MRVGPLGALLKDYSVDRLASVVYKTGAVTHASISGLSMSFAVAYCVWAFCNGHNTAQIVQELPDIVRTQEEHWNYHESDWKIDRSQPYSVSDSLRIVLGTFESLEKNLHVDVAMIRDKITENGKIQFGPAGEHKKCNPNQGMCFLGGAHAIAMALLPYLQSPTTILSDIILQGYDTDTVAAICGSILGARFGCAWIPVDVLFDQERLETYAVAVAASPTAEPLETKSQFMEREGVLSGFESRFQQKLMEQVDEKASEIERTG